ncbi:MAG: ribonuclease PH [Planctomycetes bacterium]|nr:ribonuclease PH [Planctomycetota bacterium]
MRRSTRTSREEPLARRDGRKAADLRPIEIVRGYTENAAGSVLIRAGKTMVLCTASWEQGVPRWKTGQGTGWVTAEYDMLPGSTSERKRRNRNKVDGRTQEIQRLIGRSMRSVVDLKVLGENSILIDCDVLQADGGTRTASITGAYIALCDAIKMARTKKWIKQSPIREPVAAISVGRVNGRMLLDLDYLEDVGADVDMNVVMTGSGRFIEVQGTGEEATFTRAELDKLLRLAARGIKQLVELQKKALRKRIR